MKELSFEEFQCYNPIENKCTPYPNNQLKCLLGPVIWDRSDYTRIASQLHSKTIWTIYQDSSSYYIIPTVTTGLSSNLVGYIVTEIPYETNNISNLKLIINKDEI